MTEARFQLPTSEIHNWVCYLTARCNFACDYCIQKPGMVPGERRKPWGRYDELTGRQWVEALNAYPVRPEHPLILTGGEPSLHKDFNFIASHLEGYSLDLTSNLTFDIDQLARDMNARGAVFATSFHTYHPKFISPEKFLEQAERLRDSGIVEAPVFSMVNLNRFPHFRDDEHDRNIRVFVELAEKRGLKHQANEFRGTHMGSPFERTRKFEIDCTSAWVNFAPDGEIYNCQYHLTERKNSFGNLTDIAAARPLPEFGTFFHCSDFGYCDPCHENSGHGAFPRRRRPHLPPHRREHAGLPEVDAAGEDRRDRAQPPRAGRRRRSQARAAGGRRQAARRRRRRLRDVGRPRRHPLRMRRQGPRAWPPCCTRSTAASPASRPSRRP